MGGISRSNDNGNNNGGGVPTDSAGAPATAEGLFARLSASQEALMRQLTQERDAARAQVADLETTVKELVDAMDDATKAKVDLQAEFEAFKLEAEEGKDALVQAIETAHQGQDRLEGIRARIAVFQAQANELRQGKQRLVALVKEARDEACALHRWNRQELRARREAEREAHQLRKQVARLMVGGPHGRRRGGADPVDGATAAAAGASAAATTGPEPDPEAEMAVDEEAAGAVEGAEAEAEAEGEEEPVVVEHAVVIASLESRVEDLEAALARAEAEHHKTLLVAAAARAEADALASARDEAVARGVQAEQEVEGAVRRALEERDAELEALRGDMEAGMARMGEVDALAQELAGEEAKVRALEARLADSAGTVEEAERKACSAVDEIIGLRIREDELLAQVAGLKACHAQCETQMAALREERDNWRQRAETEVAEWVGVAMDDGLEAATSSAADAPVADAAKPDDEEEAEEAVVAPTAEAAPVPVPVLNNAPPTSEELGGLDPVQALVEENLALRAELERLRGI